MTNEEIKKKALAFGDWYHAVELFPGFTTPSNMTESFHQWEQVRKVRSGLDYKGKSVLDLGTMDGMWAFEAESLGARAVTAVDIWQGNPVGEKRISFAKDVKKSNVVILRQNVQALQFPSQKFDIIQCLGLLYHVQNPLLALHNIVGCLAPKGAVLIETAVFPTEHQELWARFNRDGMVYGDATTFWAPNWNCLLAWLDTAGLSVEMPSVSVIKDRVHRVCLIARRNGLPLDPKLGLE